MNNFAVEGGSGSVISVVVPAHDEEAVVRRCLAALTDGAREGELDVVVVCNGCRDRTAEMAAAFGPPVRVIETPVASKAHALNLGDQAARGFPRFYVDADVEVGVDALREVARALEEGPALVAAPALRSYLDDRPWTVRAHERIWSLMPYAATDLVGAGVYAVSEAGRRRFGDFPPIIADDLFVPGLFAPAERARVEGCWFTQHPPTTLTGLVQRRTRVAAGRRQYRLLYPEGVGRLAPARTRPWRAILFDPRLWGPAAVYTFVWVAAELRARAHGSAATSRWERDDSARAAAAAGTGASGSRAA